jgi:toxin-antitoxin system PIN domain toxin
VIVPDLNLLLYAYDAASPDHAAAAAWWERCMNGGETIGVPYVVLFGFVRITTSSRVFAAPMPLAMSIECVREWLVRPHVLAADGGPEHVGAALDLLRKAGGAGNLTTEAQIAAVALHHSATIHTNDSDFRRFPGVRVRNPLRSRERSTG